MESICFLVLDVYFFMVGISRIVKNSGNKAEQDNAIKRNYNVYDSK